MRARDPMVLIARTTIVLPALILAWVLMRAVITVVSHPAKLLDDVLDRWAA